MRLQQTKRLIAAVWDIYVYLHARVCTCTVTHIFKCVRWANSWLDFILHDIKITIWVILSIHSRCSGAVNRLAWQSQIYVLPSGLGNVYILRISKSFSAMMPSVKLNFEIKCPLHIWQQWAEQALKSHPSHEFKLAAPAGSDFIIPVVVFSPYVIRISGTWFKIFLHDDARMHDFLLGWDLVRNPAGKFSVYLASGTLASQNTPVLQGVQEFSTMMKQFNVKTLLRDALRRYFC